MAVVAPGDRVDSCPLCRAERITTWYHEDDVCWIADCEICATPMVVWRWHGTDVPADVLRETLALFSEKRVAALVYNAQTTGATTDQVVSAAKAAGIPVVPVTETLPADLPAGSGYIEWMTENVDAVADALGR